MPATWEDRMRRAAAKARADVLDTEDRRLLRDLSTVLHSADIFWLGASDDHLPELQDEVDAFEDALREAGLRTVPRLCDSLRQALQGHTNQELTLKFDEAQFDAAKDELREAVLELTTWSPGAAPARVFAQGSGGRPRDEEVTTATVTDAAGGLCMICISRERLSQPLRIQTFDVLHLLAPKLSVERLDKVDRCLRQVEAGEPFDAALHPGLTGANRIGVIPLWPDPAKGRQRWAVAAGHSWVFATPGEEIASDDIDRVIRQMVPRWERASLPKHGAALGSVLVEVAIESAARRAQELGRGAERVFQLRQGDDIRAALDRLAEDLAELNAGLDELEVAAADSRADLERKVASSSAARNEAQIYRSLCRGLEEALAKLDRQQQRLQGSFLAACEHASSHHVAETVEDLRAHQEEIARNQRATDDLNRIVGRLTIMLLGPTIVFGALSVTDHWLPAGAYFVSVGLLVVYVLAGLVVSWLILGRIDFFTRHFTPTHPSERARLGNSSGDAEQQTPKPDGDPSPQRFPFPFRPP
ncbi:MAG: hypothetical protein ACTHN3_13140 [Solirubrobacterales bacterium]